RRWSATQLNDYGLCAFRFFAKRLLRLDTLEDPEEGLDSLKLGNINHEILEQTYAEVHRRGLHIIPENADEAAAILRTVAAAVIKDAPQVQGFRPSAAWEQEKVLVVRRLEALIHLDFSADSPINKKFNTPNAPRRPYMLEAPFNNVWIPISVNGRSEHLTVRGFIDRMDRVGDGVVVVDYKTGTSPISVNDMREGRQFQMMVYLWAARSLLAAPVDLIGGLFWHIRHQELKTSGEMLVANPDHHAAMEQALEHIGRFIDAGRHGDFTVKSAKPSGGRCSHFCEYSRFCRAAGTHQGKD
ncbi:MAG: PD-(D/E)XK nuclease family protein, partial [Anaerolineae bacterium]|nr:PD-(D/E)XK nuclease family protein [Anaerolineae bacterium]